VDGVFDADGRLFGLQKEFARTAYPEAVIGRVHVALDPDGVLVDDVLVRLGVSIAIVDVPAQGLEKRIDEFEPDLGFVIASGMVGVAP
jgi:hypothetical protein